MTRRLHTSALRSGIIELSPAQAHHARDVLRLRTGEPVELFDDAGASASAVIEAIDERGVSVRVERLHPPAAAGASVTIAAAVPKGERADWMVEKLSELGVRRFIPLQAARSVVVPAGRNKRERWQRLATESAKQSRRPGVMVIDELTGLESLLDQLGPPAGCGCFLSTAPEATAISQVLQGRRADAELLLLVGPEGGWTNEELRTMHERGLTAVKLTETILRVETAAIAAAAVALCLRPVPAAAPASSGPP